MAPAPSLDLRDLARPRSSVAVLLGALLLPAVASARKVENSPGYASEVLNCVKQVCVLKDGDKAIKACNTGEEGTKTLTLQLDTEPVPFSAGICALGVSRDILEDGEEDNVELMFPKSNVGSLDVLQHILRFGEDIVARVLDGSYSPLALEKPLREKLSPGSELAKATPLSEHVTDLEVNCQSEDTCKMAVPLYDALLAADYLDLPDFIELASARIASAFWGKVNIEEIREILKPGPDTMAGRRGKRAVPDDGDMEVSAEDDDGDTDMMEGQAPKKQRGIDDLEVEA